MSQLMRKPNKVREKLARGECVLGTAIYSSSPAVVEAVGFAGIDFIRIDTEHTWRRDESLDHMLRAAIIADLVAVVRVDKNDPELIRKALEVGAGGIVVPQIVSVEEARAVVRAAKFPPVGTRGYGGLCQSGEWGARAGGEWIEWSNTQPIIGIMVETVSATDCVDELMRVEGLDFVLFGPSDYSLSLGLPAPDTAHPKVQEGLNKTIAAARAAGKHVMFGVGTQPEAIARGIEQGVTMLELAHDVAIVQRTLQDRVASFGGKPAAER